MTFDSENTSSSTPRRRYTTMRVIALAEKRRLKEEAEEAREAAERENAAKTNISENKAVPIEEDLKPPLLLSTTNTPQINEEVSTIDSQVQIGPPQENTDVVDLTAPLLISTTDTPQINEEVKTFISQVQIRPCHDLTIVEPIEEDESKNPIPNNANKLFLIFNLSLTAFLLMVSFKLPEPWLNSAAAKLNSMILYGSFFIFSVAQQPCSVVGSVLNMQSYKISLQGDLIAFYSLQLLIFLAVLMIFVQKTTWEKRAMVFISLFPLALVANIIRVIWACGIALNYGTATADRYFHGLLAVFVFIFIVIGLILFEFLASSDSNKTDRLNIY
jgi:exosortase/archaeosortase family protein